MAVANFKISKRVNLLLNAGPYFGIGVGGCTWNEKCHSVYADYISIEDYNFTSKPTFGKDGLNRVDIGFGIGVKFKVRRILFGYDWRFGLLNSSVRKYVNGKEVPYKLRNESTFFTIGYSF